MTGTSCGEVVRSMIRGHCESQADIDYVEVFLDFENAIPTPEEVHLFELSEKVLYRCSGILMDVSDYKLGASDEIRKHLQNPDDEKAHVVVMDVVGGLIDRIRGYYDLSQRIEQIVPQLLWDLCSGPLPPEEQLDTKQATARQLARLVDFVLDFDAVKMGTPALQNDFSFYRRSLNRLEQGSAEVEAANQISLFLAAPTPMLSSLRTALIKFVECHPSLPIGNTTDTLATIVSVCRYMVDSEEARCRLNAAARMFCVRVMVGCLILYDHIDEIGAFVRDSPINLKGVVQVIRQQTSEPQTSALLNALRYTSKHFNLSTTPKSVRAILAD